MMRIYGFVFASLFSIGLVACASEDVSPPIEPDPVEEDRWALHLEGYYRLETMTISNEIGEATELTAESLPDSIRGVVEFVPTSDTTADMSVRVAMLSDGLLGLDGVETDVMPASFDATHVRLGIEDDREQVFSWTFVDGRLELERDGAHVDDMGTDETDGPVALRLQRIPAPEAQTAGTWSVVEWTDPSGEMGGSSDCYADDDGFGTFGVDVDIDGDFQFEGTTHRRRYSDAACTVEIAHETEIVTGFVEENGDLMQLWSITEEDLESSQRLDLRFRTEGERLVLDRVDCAPSPDCQGDGPSQMVLAPR